MPAPLVSLALAFRPSGEAATFVMTPFLSGLGVALAISIPPGANTAFCLSLARDGVRRAAPVIVGAAAVDAGYALMGATGAILQESADLDPLRWLGPVFMAVAAWLLWPREERSPRAASRTAAGVAALNPATAVLWLSVTPHVGLGAGSALAPCLWVLGVAAGTAAWFSVVALLSSRLHRTLSPTSQQAAQRALAGLLGATALVLAAAEAPWPA